jgi:hypothetical protein
MIEFIYLIRGWRLINIEKSLLGEARLNNPPFISVEENILMDKLVCRYLGFKTKSHAYMAP